MGKVIGLVAASGLLVLSGCGGGAASRDDSGSGADGGVGATADAGAAPASGGTSGSGKAGSEGSGATQGLAGSPDEPLGGMGPDGMGGTPGNEAGASGSEAGASGSEAGAPNGEGGMPSGTGGSNTGGTRGGSDTGGTEQGGTSAAGNNNGGSAGNNGGSAGSNNGGSAGGGNPGPCEGKNDGTPCGDQATSACDLPDTCARGTCAPNFADPGTDCGKPASECDAPSQCSDQGKCEIKFKLSGSPCGNQQTNTTCDKPDSCDGSGYCDPNLTEFLVACGDGKDGACDNPDFCDGDGICDQAFEPKGTSCGSNTNTACNKPDSCDGDGTCLANFEKLGTACGSSADTQCDNPDKCNETGTCLPNYEPGGTPCGSASNTDCSAPDYCADNGTCMTNHLANDKACEDCAAGIGQCDGCSSGSCTDSALCPITSYPLSTGYASNSNAAGVMFDMAATDDVTLRGFDVNLLPGTHTVSVYATTSTPTYVGEELTAASWTLLKSYPNITGTAAAGATSLPQDLEYTLAAGTSRGFFITLTSTLDQRTLIGTGIGTVEAADGLLTIKEGTGRGSGGFVGIQVYPRAFSGSVHYTRSITTQLTGGGGNDGVMFDVDAASDVRIQGVRIEPFGTGNFDVELWYRNGSHVGHENAQADWTLVDAYSSVPMVDGKALRLPVVTDMIFEAGSTHGLYVTATDTGGLRATIGSATGTAIKSDGRLTIRSGTGKTYPFGLSYGNREPNVSLEYDSCPDPTP